MRPKGQNEPRSHYTHTWLRRARGPARPHACLGRTLAAPLFLYATSRACASCAEVSGAHIRVFRSGSPACTAGLAQLFLVVRDNGTHGANSLKSMCPVQTYREMVAGVQPVPHATTMAPGPK